MIYDLYIISLRQIYINLKYLYLNIRSNIIMLKSFLRFYLNYNLNLCLKEHQIKEIYFLIQINIFHFTFLIIFFGLYL
jgi:hypothetical protein